GGSAPAEEVAGRRTGRWDLARQPEVGENLPDDDRVLDRGDHPHAPATPGAGEDIDGKGVVEEVSPGPGARGGARRRCLRGGRGLLRGRRAERPVPGRQSGREWRGGGCRVQRCERVPPI